MLVLAFRAGYGFGHFEYGLLIYVRHPCFAPVRHEELRRNGSAKHLVLAPQLPLQNPESVKEDQLGFELRFRLVLLDYERVAGDEKVVGGFEAIHISRTIGPLANRIACRPLGMKFFTGCNQLRALPSSLQKLT